MEDRGSGLMDVRRLTGVHRTPGALKPRGSGAPRLLLETGSDGGPDDRTEPGPGPARSDGSISALSTVRYYIPGPYRLR
eukprot:345049-Hanusia_phi.AAC.2